jgi:DNA-binding transcriptional ArsR family regulator
VDHARARLLDLVRRGPRPVVELAADADLPLTVVRVLLGDLAEAGLVRIDPPRRTPRGGASADPELLQEIVRRLREL